MYKVGTILIDCDGVLTDGKVYFDQHGDRIKGFHSRDIRALRELIAHGFRVVILTQSSWPGISDFAKRTGAEIVIDRGKSVDEYENFIAVGDDTPDIKMLTKAVRAFCPADADPEILTMNNVEILHTKGGEGVISEVVTILSKEISSYASYKLPRS